ncbi:MAG: hypothetical protein H0W88_02560 [Parachlamydiaceae bacterium]|nr:hypothetical protein [Parachlamydiaceae bacterium]
MKILSSAACLNFIKNQWNGVRDQNTNPFSRLGHAFALIFPGIIAITFFLKLIEYMGRIKPIQENTPISTTVEKVKDVTKELHTQDNIETPSDKPTDKPLTSNSDKISVTAVPKEPITKQIQEVPKNDSNKKPVEKLTQNLTETVFAKTSTTIKDPITEEPKKPEEVKKDSKNAVSTERLGSKVIASHNFETVYKGGPAAITLISTAYSTIFSKIPMGDISVNITKLLNFENVQKFLQSKRLPNGTVNSFDFEGQKDLTILKELNISDQNVKFNITSRGVVCDNRVIYGTKGLVEREDLKIALEEWYSSSSTGAVLMLPWTSRAIKKVGSNIELLDQVSGTQQADNTKMKIYIRLFEDVNSTVNWIITEIREEIKNSNLSQFDMLWYSSDQSKPVVADPQTAQVAPAKKITPQPENLSKVDKPIVPPKQNVVLPKPLLVSTSGKVVFAGANQYNAGGPAACTLASIAFAASSSKTKKVKAMEDVFALIKKAEIQAFLKTKIAPNGTVDPFDLDEPKDTQILKDNNIFNRGHPTAGSTTGMSFDNRVSFGSDEVVKSNDLMKGIKEWLESNATGATLIVAGAAIGMRKEGDDLQIFEPHGETEFLKQRKEVFPKDCNSSAYVIELLNAQDTANYIYALHGEKIRGGGCTQYDMAWYYNQT